MARPTRKQIASALLDRHGQTFAQELKVPLEKNAPSALFRWLCASILFSARIGAPIATRAARALARAKWTTPQKMAQSTWEERTRVLNQSGYARYDERTSTMLGETAQQLLDRYDGDLRKLREEAERNPEQERKRLRRFKGMGETGVDIFFREVQIVWDEIAPFADRRALKAADRLGLGSDARAIARLVDRQDFARLVAALVRADLEGDLDAILDQSGQSKSRKSA